MKVIGIALAFAVVAAASLNAAEPQASPAKLSSAPEITTSLPAPLMLAAITNTSCPADLETKYYSDAAHTTLVGHCTITCHQFDLGTADPTFSGGGTCTGVASNFNIGVFYVCPCPP